MVETDLERPARVAAVLGDRFDEAGLPYALGGALALGVWSVPRATADVDVSVFVRPERLAEIFDALERAGALIDYDDARERVDQAGLFIVRLLGIRVDIFVAHHPLHDDMATRRRSVRDPFGDPRWFLSPEDVALTKLIYHRPKDVMDLERLFAVQGERLDLSYVRDWLQKIVPAGDIRHATLGDLEARFAHSRG